MKRPGGFDREVMPPTRLTPRSGPPHSEPSALRREVPSEAGADNLRSSGTDSGHADPRREDAHQETVELSDLARPASALERSGAKSGAGALARLRWAQPTDPIKAAERRVREAEKRTKRRQRRETQRFTAAARRSRQRALIVLGAVGGLVLFVALVVFTPIMAVKEVRVEGAQNVNVADLERALARFDGVPLALIEEREVLRALEAFPLIQKFAVERVPPHTLLVRVEERIPVIAVETDGAYQLYDAAGVLVGSAAERPEGVPLGVDSARQTASPAFAAAARVVRDLPAELRAQVTTAGARTGQDVTLVLESGVEVFWGNADKTKKKSVILQTMLSSLVDRPVSHVDVSSTEAPVFK